MTLRSPLWQEAIAWILLCLWCTSSIAGPTARQKEITRRTEILVRMAVLNNILPPKPQARQSPGQLERMAAWNERRQLLINRADEKGLFNLQGPATAAAKRAFRTSASTFIEEQKKDAVYYEPLVKPPVPARPSGPPTTEDRVAEKLAEMEAYRRRTGVNTSDENSAFLEDSRRTDRRRAENAVAREEALSNFWVGCKNAFSDLVFGGHGKLPPPQRMD
jgi:hypothetical protein